MSVFQTPPPDFSLNDVSELVQTHYGMEVRVKALDSERDQNFLIQNGGQSFVLKISNPAEEFDVLDMQNKVMQHIINEDSRFDLTLPVPSLNSEKIVQVEKDGQTNWVRILKYIHGQFLKDSTHHNSMLFELGTFLARLDHAMEGFDHPAAHRSFPWDGANTDFLVSHKKFIKNNREIVDHFLEQYENNVLIHESHLRKMVIHNDGNDHNVLVNGNGETTGIIDFGDMIYTFITLEPAVCMAYVALEREEPLSSISEVLKGYNQSFPLNEFELKSALYLMCLRLCITITMAAYRKSLFPDNAYISVNENQAWAFLEKMKHEDLNEWSKQLTAYVES
ncbi:MAG: phosphotransferase [Candidatus Marinimicrobia bacterium]|jgi:Ser/Thr protein kinase RdoA (MazF antagonist)|nr:phosphotransferase [Candidatus Neomarinimicrobiota bacterium]MDP6611210.1 phosphotransferase [Candidatus Neomarinimicrobiota bacterium]|tara:strand:+ start:35307 stop:36314 length:1008 start_codon:yes stop_codon:yes gene_type:complete